MKRVTISQTIKHIKLKYRRDVYLPVRVVARTLCLHRNTIYRMIESGVFDHYGGVHSDNSKGDDKPRILIPTETLINYMEANLSEI